MDQAQFWFQDGPGGGGGDAGDPIGQSLRGHFPDGGYMIRKFTVASGKTYTHSFWAKTAAVNAYDWWFSSSTTGFFCGLNNNTNIFSWYGTVDQEAGVKYRDPSAWMHICHVSDGTTVTRYINGRNTGTAAATNFCNAGANHHVGTYTNIGGWRFNGYMADVHFVHDQALDPTTFGRFNANGVWVPVDPKKDGDTAWYGANGFHLTFADPNDIGKDYSGNNNHFTDNGGFELTDTSSPDYDVMQDSPTQNFATLNPLKTPNDELKDANLTGTGYSAVTMIHPVSTIEVTDKVYIELPSINVVGGYPCFGMSHDRQNIGVTTEGPDFYMDANGWVYHSTGFLPDQLFTAFTSGDTMTMAYDRVNQLVWYGKNSAPDVTQPGNTIPTQFQSDEKAFVWILLGAATTSINYGQQPYQYTPPEGFEPLQTANMPTDELPDTITGTFTGNSSADGPFVYTGCIPARIQYGTIDVKYQDRLGQTDVDFLSNGFKLRSTTSNSGTVNYTVTTTHDGGEYDGFKVPFNSPAPAVSN